MAPAAAAPLTVLGDDLLQEVFIRLPAPADLLRAAAACKPFLGAVRCARFLRRFRRRHASTFPPLLGCLVLRCNRGHLHHQEPNPARLLTPSAAARRVADRGDFALSFLPHRTCYCGAMWQVLDCRNSRLLLSTWVSRQLMVADPLTRHWVSLPMLPSLSFVGYGLVADHGDSSVFQVVCISREGASLRVFLLSSGEHRWDEVARFANQSNFACTRAMQANKSLYWKLEGGERMVAFNTLGMEFFVIDLPPVLRFDIIEKGEEDDGGIYILTMRDFYIETWVGVKTNTGSRAWKLLEKSVRFRRVLHGGWQDIIGVVAGVLFLRHHAGLVSIDLDTMRLRRLPEREDGPLGQIYPYTMAWPPSCLNPTEQGA
ncbi:LOW QUALITY PROTEIN: hypothetical protein BRADI_2g36100v3 [Brachypodium distachyon]|uniref:F-box protein AT5G49610-like beta-propeller domain-containing protein n=1 Tax=Brachypodium distachyon TaxID=15368 RepID=A0A2K2DC34_BRADI|nr:LOW QUALITY PROTEIN: hypothetical protein BRADI_2g36100v3 [Brachypodium distachyon]